MLAIIIYYLLWIKFITLKLSDFPNWLINIHHVYFIRDEMFIKLNNFSNMPQWSKLQTYTDITSTSNMKTSES